MTIWEIFGTNWESFGRHLVPFARFVISIYLGYLVSNRYFSQNLVSKRCLFDSKVSSLWKYVKRTIFYKCEVHGAHILC